MTAVAATEVIEIPACTERGSQALLTTYLDAYFDAVRSDSDDAAIIAGEGNVRSLAEGDGWLHQELVKLLDELDHAFRVSLGDTVRQLANLHGGKTDLHGGFSQVDQAHRSIQRIPGQIRTMLDAACNVAINQAREVRS